MTHARKHLVPLVISFLLLLTPATVSLAQNSNAAQTRPKPSAQPDYLNPRLNIDQRVNDLVSRMTAEEKASQFTNTSSAIPRLTFRRYGNRPTAYCAALSRRRPCPALRRSSRHLSARSATPGPASC